jgi:nuclear transport factor 2 (NTF2) superfamily protein
VRACRLSSVNAFFPTEISTVSPRASPPFTAAGALEKVRLIEDSWNSRDPNWVALAYTIDSHWRNGAEFLSGRAAIEAFLSRKWARELEYRLITELWALTNERLGVRVAYEFHDDSGSWFRAYGSESWEFDADGLIRRRIASAEERPIVESNRSLHWPLGRRPDAHPGLGDLGF